MANEGQSNKGMVLPEGQDLRRAHGAASRERLLAAASALFAEQGVARTGVEAVARRAGVVKSALYWHFRSKQGLVAAVVERLGESWLREIRASVEETGDLDARLDRFVAGLRGLVEDRPELLRFFLVVALERSDVAPASRRAAWAVLGRGRDAIVQVLHETLGSELPDAEGIANLALEMLMGIAVERMLAPTEADPGPRFERLRRTVAREIRAQMRRAGRPIPPPA